MKRRQKRKSNILILAGVTGCLLVTQPVCAQETNRQKSEQKTVITANVAHYIEEPSYIMSIPSAANFGALDFENDQIQNYSIDIDVKDKTGILTVSAPEGGILNSGTNTLKFENDFGNQEIVLSDLKDEEKITKSLSGTLTIRGDEIKAAAPGNYTGTTTFTITYTSKKSDTDNKNNGNSGNNNNNNSGNGNQNAANGISNTLKKNTLGSNTLGSGKLGSSTLGGSKLGSTSGSLASANKTGSSLKTASVKTGDTGNYGVWMAAMVSSVVCLALVFLKKKRQKKDMGE